MKALGGRLSSAPGFTFWWRGYLDADPTETVGFICNRSSSLGPGEIFIYSTAANSAVIATFGASDGSGTSFIPNSAQPLNFIITGDTSSTDFYANNVLNTDSTPAFFAALTSHATNPTTFSASFAISDAVTSNVPSAVFYIGGFWARRLSAAEVTELRKDPYQFLIPA